VPSIDELEIADDAAAWTAAGFDVADDVCRVGRVRLRLAGKGERRGILGWTLRDQASGDAAGPHPNGTVGELEAQGFDLRRRREGETPGGSTRQAFFRAGEPILEVVQAPERTSVARDPDGPARLWGLAFLVADMDRTARALGELLGRPRDAVQPGRRIATLRPEAGLGPAIAFMTSGAGAI
jgi:hypothetical protein